MNLLKKILTLKSFNFSSALVATILVSQAIQARPSSIFSKQTVCRSPIQMTLNALICSQDAYKLLDKSNKYLKVANSIIQNLRLYPENFGIADDSASPLKGYRYTSMILNSAGQHIGFISVDGYLNSDSNSAWKLSVYYSVTGKFLAAKVN